MGCFKDISIKDVIDEINRSYFIPDIQREYVWLNNYKEKKIEKLFDSILRGYPIGSFLFWKLKSSDIETDKGRTDDDTKLNFQLYKFIERYDIRSPHNEKINIEQVVPEDLHIVLDGQQRLTSLFIGIRGSRTLRRPYAKNETTAYEEKKLYLNLKYHPTDDNPDDIYAFDFFSSDGVPENDTNNYWYKVADVLSLDTTDIFKMVQNNQLETKDAIILQKLHNAICTDMLISYYEEDEKNLDKVLKIFIRVNSGGTALSYSDLLMSILTATFSSDIRGNMEKFVDVIAELGFSGFGRDHILKTCLILTDTNHIFNLKNFSKANISKIENSWVTITTTINDAVKIVKDLGYAGFLQQSYVISIIAYYLLTKNYSYNDISSKRLTDIDAIWQFIKAAQIKAFFTSGLDGKLSAAINEIRQCSDFSDFNNRMANNHYLKVTADDIEWMMELQYNNKTYLLPVLQTLYPSLDYKNSTFHIDHIFPRSKFNDQNTQLDSQYLEVKDYIFNLQLLEGAENISKNDTHPEIWLQNHFNNDPNKIKNYKTSNYIDPDKSLEWNDFKSFMDFRTDKIKEALINAFI